MILSAVCLIPLLVQLISGLKVPVIGDWGDITSSGIANQKTTAEVLADWCDKTQPDNFIWSTGDNFYQVGVTEPTSPRFDSSWKHVYNQSSLIDKVWYQSLGNHDHGNSNPGDGREWNQVLYGRNEPRWYMPNRWYDHVFHDPAGFSVHLIVLDSESLRYNKNNASVQLQWFEETLAASTSEWRILIAHHPPYSAGHYGPIDKVMSRDVVPILKRHKVNLYLSGHDHNLQHLSGDNMDYIVTGAGGRGLYRQSSSGTKELNKNGIEVNFFGYYHGFTNLEFSAKEMIVKFVDMEGVVTYSFTRSV